MTELKRILMQRDELSAEEADDLILEMREAVYAAGEDPEAVLHDYAQLEPDYVCDLLG